jgi:FtsH-binding integral membrane protein
MSFDQISSNSYGSTVVDSTTRNRVLRNTYLMLAISMIPTVLGAWLGVATGLFQSMLGSPIISLVVFLAGAFGFCFMIEKNKNSGSGVFWLLGFTFFMGVMLSRMVGFWLGTANGANIIATAFGGTAFIFFGMAAMGSIIKKDLSNLGKFLMMGVWVVFAVSILAMFIHSSVLYLALSAGVLVIFSLFVLYDVNRIVQGGETNYITATLSLYLSLYNIFQSLLSILGIMNSND